MSHPVEQPPLVDGDERLAWTETVVFLAVHGTRIDVSFDDGFALVISVAAGELDEVPDIAERVQAVHQA